MPQNLLTRNDEKKELTIYEFINLCKIQKPRSLSEKRGLINVKPYLILQWIEREDLLVLVSDVYRKHSFVTNITKRKSGKCLKSLEIKITQPANIK